MDNLNNFKLGTDDRKYQHARYSQKRTCSTQGCNTRIINSNKSSKCSACQIRYCRERYNERKRLTNARKKRELQYFDVGIKSYTIDQLQHKDTTKFLKAITKVIHGEMGISLPR